MVSFATPDMVNAFTGANFDTARAQQGLDQATGLIQSWTNQNIFAVAGDTVTIDPYNDGSAYLPELPVTDVSRVDYLDRDGAWQTLDPRYYRWNAQGKLYLVKRPQFWPYELDSLRVTYDHGYSAIPADLMGVCVQIAARLLANPWDAQAMITGLTQMRFSGTRGTDGLKDTELRTLGRYSVVEVG